MSRERASFAVVDILLARLTQALGRCAHAAVLMRGAGFFFFQAEDGIRDIGVTGVQTCALPILAQVVCLAHSHEGGGRADPLPSRPGYGGDEVDPGNSSGEEDGSRGDRLAVHRSEERRVGKACRSRWSPYHYKKKSMLLSESD